MFDSVVGVLGLATSVYGLWSADQEAARINLKLDDLDKSIASVQALVENQLKVGDQQLCSAWEHNTNEIAVQIVRRAIKMASATSREVSVVIADPRTIKYTFGPPTNAPSNAATTIIIPATSQRLSWSAPQGYDQYFQSCDKEGGIEILNPEPILLRTPSPTGNGPFSWAERLARIGADQKEEPSIFIDTDYWRARLSAIGAADNVGSH